MFHVEHFPHLQSTEDAGDAPRQARHAPQGYNDQDKRSRPHRLQGQISLNPRLGGLMPNVTTTPIAYKRRQDSISGKCPVPRPDPKGAETTHPNMFGKQMQFQQKNTRKRVTKQILTRIIPTMFRGLRTTQYPSSY